MLYFSTWFCFFKLFPIGCIGLTVTTIDRFHCSYSAVSAVCVCPSQHAEETRYKFATPSTMKPTQIKCSEGSINQVPAWAEVQGDIRLTPFYNVADCMKKVQGYVDELNAGGGGRRL